MNNLLYVGIVKTIWFNFRYLPMKQAVKLPFVLARNVRVDYCIRGFCAFVGGGSTGSVAIGFNRHCNKGFSSLISFRGKLIIRGNGIHSIGAGCEVRVGKGAILDIGNNFGCTGETKLTIKKYLKIGDNNLWSYNCVVMDNDGHSIFDENGERINEPKPIVFGERVWMGSNCIILKGSEIPSGCIIASGSMIGRKVEGENNIITSGGRILRSNITWHE